MAFGKSFSSLDLANLKRVIMIYKKIYLTMYNNFFFKKQLILNIMGKHHTEEAVIPILLLISLDI